MCVCDRIVGPGSGRERSEGMHAIANMVAEIDEGVRGMLEPVAAGAGSYGFQSG